MTRNDIRVKFNKEKDLHVLQTEGTGYIHYTDDYVHWLEDIALRQANGAEQSDSNCNIPLVSGSAVLRDKHGKEIFAGQKFKFKLMKELDEHIELLGSFDYNDEELRYEIDIWDNADYTCLSYIANGTMYDFELL